MRVCCFLKKKKRNNSKRFEETRKQKTNVHREQKEKTLRGVVLTSFWETKDERECRRSSVSLSAIWWRHMTPNTWKTHDKRSIVKPRRVHHCTRHNKVKIVPTAEPWRGREHDIVVLFFNHKSYCFTSIILFLLHRDTFFPRVRVLWLMIGRVMIAI